MLALLSWCWLYNLGAGFISLVLALLSLCWLYKLGVGFITLVFCMACVCYTQLVCLFHKLSVYITGVCRYCLRA